MILVLIGFHWGFLHAEAAVVGNEKWSVYHRQPSLFVELRLCSKLFCRVAKDTPFASCASLCYPGSSDSELFCSRESRQSLPRKLDSSPVYLRILFWVGYEHSFLLEVLLYPPYCHSFNNYPGSVSPSLICLWRTVLRFLAIPVLMR